MVFKSTARLALPFFLIGLSVFACKKEDATTGDAGSSSIVVDEGRTVARALALNAATHDDPTDHAAAWDAASEILIALGGASIAVSPATPNVVVAGSSATISAAGNYRLKGALADGQIKISTTDAAPVRLILDGASLASSTDAPILIENAGKTIVFLVEGTTNALIDGAMRASGSEADAALFSKDALTITGGGTLKIEARFADGITSKDGLIIGAGAKLTIAAKDDGLRGKDYLVVENAEIEISAGGDGLKSDNDSTATKGFVHIADGSLDIAAKADGIQAAEDVLIEKGVFRIATNGGSSVSLASGATAKGLKAGRSLIVEGGTFDLSTSDDALHSNAHLTVSGGSLVISTKDDGLHADTTVVINGGSITVSKSNEALESRAIVINGGELRLTASDDGINAAGGADGSASGNFPGAPQTAATSEFFIKIKGGRIAVTSAGDGIDANGALFFAGGETVVHGPTAQNNGPLDYDTGCETTGGSVIAAGSSRMAQAPGGASSSTQRAVLATFGSAQAAGQIARIESASGEVILAVQPSKAYESLAFTSSKFEKGGSYKIVLGGTASSMARDGLFDAGTTFAGGTTKTTFTTTNLVTTTN